MAFEFKIDIKEEFSYKIFLERLLENFKANELTNNSKILDNRIEILDPSSSWGKWFELYRDGENIIFWITSHKLEMDIVINTIKETLSILNVLQYDIDELDE